jgi:hypothetical protein
VLGDASGYVHLPTVAEVGTRLARLRIERNEPCIECAAEDPMLAGSTSLHRTATISPGREDIMTKEQAGQTITLNELQPAARATPSETREGLDISLGPASVEGGVAASAVWTVAGWCIQFVRLAPGARVGLDHDAGQIYVKVITGQLANIERGAFAGAKQVRSTLVKADHIEAGADGALCAVLTATSAVPDNIASMEALAFGGSNAELFKWAAFGDKFGQFTDAFNGLDAYIVPGFHLLDDDGTEIVYVHFWTAGKGVDLTTHNHGNAPSDQAPAFAEVHWVFNNGTGRGGMYECAEPGAPERQRYPMVRGEEHGAFFVSDANTGSPVLRDNGAVEYPWHGWEAGSDDEPGQAFDFVAAFETNPKYVTIN